MSNPMNSSTHCQPHLLQQSLSDQLTEQQEEQLVLHLEECPACRTMLEQLAADHGSWQEVGTVLRNERHGVSLNAFPGGSRHIPSTLASGDADDHQDYGESLRPSDFIVEFLQPATNSDSLGRIGNIEIRQFIGQGAHGIVLKGFQEELNRLVAVKVMAPHLASVIAARKRFAREARATAAIVHPNVLPILQVDSSGQLPFLVMPYVDCESLQDRLDREGPLPLLDVLRIAVQVAKGLAAAHAQGLVHRDVKPANILLERGVERVMLTDFGLARAVDDATLTRSGLIAGTPHYMSPEQARGEGVDTRSDLFSLGSVLYAMTAGRPPFRAETAYGILRRVTDDAPRSIRELNPEIPDWFDGIVMRLLRKSADERFASADEIAQVLEDCLAHVLQPNAIPLPEAARNLGLGKQPESIRKISILSAAGILIAGVLAYGFFDRPLETSETSIDPEVEMLPKTPTAASSQWNDGVAEKLKALESETNDLLEESTHDAPL